MASTIRVWTSVLIIIVLLLTAKVKCYEKSKLTFMLSLFESDFKSNHVIKTVFSLRKFVTVVTLQFLTITIFYKVHKK